MHRWHMTLSEIHTRVQQDRKRRYKLAMLKDRVMIKCVQGHSISAALDNHLLQPFDPGRLKVHCVHGTYSYNCGSIQALLTHVMYFNILSSRDVSAVRNSSIYIRAIYSNFAFLTKLPQPCYCYVCESDPLPSVWACN